RGRRVTATAEGLLAATAGRLPLGCLSSVTGADRLEAELGPILNLSGDFLRIRAGGGCGSFRSTAGQAAPTLRQRTQTTAEASRMRGCEQSRGAAKPENFG